eukprot:CAMPEP_0195252876 /NCGR_PEP_ID=MMETSP0706-20130129/4130_1 /TAXON_ID=33640 /ORGANISM="Asterionellopsis glacialis, Strain CCMP134" /LENGTH=232 /DNA_ID=CAMNT_0040305269 /DNA_START=19 /DNA_END=718 /DNA_ORIENTATION=+
MNETVSDPVGNLIFALLIVGVAIGLFAVVAFFLKKKFNLAALGQKQMQARDCPLLKRSLLIKNASLFLFKKTELSEHLVLVGGPTDLVIETSTASAPQSNVTSPIAENITAPTTTSTTETAAQTAAQSAPPALNSEQDAIDFFDQARDRIFAPQDAQSTKPAQPKPVMRDDTDDFHSVLQSQQNTQPKTQLSTQTNTKRSQPLEPIPETAEERVNKLKALLDEAQKSRLNKS